METYRERPVRKPIVDEIAALYADYASELGNDAMPFWAWHPNAPLHAKCNICSDEIEKRVTTITLEDWMKEQYVNEPGLKERVAALVVEMEKEESV